MDSLLLKLKNMGKISELLDAVVSGDKDKLDAISSTIKKLQKEDSKAEAENVKSQHEKEFPDHEYCEECDCCVVCVCCECEVDICEGCGKKENEECLVDCSYQKRMFGECSEDEEKTNIIFNCCRCNKNIIENSEDHDLCNTKNGDDWWCEDCGRESDWE